MSEPIPMLLWCPSCLQRHTHACQHCGMVWRPCILPTVGVQYLPGFKDVDPPQVMQ